MGQWSATFEVVVVLEALGIIIFAFREKDEDDVSEMDEKMNLAAIIEKVPTNIGKKHTFDQSGVGCGYN